MVTRRDFIKVSSMSALAPSLVNGGAGAPVPALPPRIGILPEKEFVDFTPPPQTIPNSPGHHIEQIEACKGGKPSLASFDYSGWTTEANHLGNVAYRAGKKLEWDAGAMKAANAPEADRFIRREYRKEWEDLLKG